MKKQFAFLTVALMLLLSANIWAVTLYVGTVGTPGGSYYTEIQAAVDAAVAGDLILVSNGIYNTGGTSGEDGVSPTTNRVLCAKAVEIRSVDGPDATFIVGAPDAGTGGNGPGAVRCVCFPWNSGATLSGFTLTNGYTLTTGDSNREQGGGGARIRLNGVITNCIIIGNHGYGRGGGLNLQSGKAYDCQIINNIAEANTGGGVFAQRADGVNTPGIYNCIIADNNAVNDNGGGVYGYDGVNIYNTTISGNRCGTAVNVGKGGGVFLLNRGEVQDCIIVSNTAHLWGGGINTEGSPGAIVSRCNIQYNNTETHGGGGAMLYNYGEICDSLISENNSDTHAGGVYFVSGGTVYNCTIVTNHAGGNGGGIAVDTSCTIANSIILDNTVDGGDPNWSKGPGGTAVYNCSSPALSGDGNIGTNNAFFVNASAENWRLTSVSPCVNAGTNAYASSYDLDGNPRITGGTVDMGCYEFIPEPSLIMGFISLLGCAFLRRK